LPPRPVPDFVIRPPVYNSGLPALTTPSTKVHWGRWLSAALVLVVVLGIAAYAWRDEIRSRLPPEWASVLSLDAVRGLLRK